MPEIVIVDASGKEHVFPDGFDPKRAASIVQQQAAPASSGPVPDFQDPNPLNRIGQAVTRFVKAHPVAVGATAGALAVPTGGMSLLPAMAAAGLGAAGGAGLGIAGRQLATGKPEPALDTAKTMATEGAMGAGGEGVGRAVGAGLKLLGRGAYRVALAPTQQTLGKYGDVVGQGLETATPVSKGGLVKATAGKAAKMAEKKAALSAADQTVNYSAKQIADEASKPLADYSAQQIRAGFSNPMQGGMHSAGIADQLAQFQAANPSGSLTPTSLDAVKSTLDDAAGLAYRKIRGREPLAPTEKYTVEMARAMSRAQEAAVPGYREMNRGIMDAEGLRKAIERRTLGSGGNQVLDTLLMFMRGGAGIPGRIAMMPPLLSRAGIVTHEAGKAATPTLKAAILAALSPDVPEK